MFPSFVPLAAEAELVAAEAVPEEPPPQANRKATLKIKKTFIFIILPIYKIY